MTPRSALGAIAGAFGVVVGVIGAAALVAAVLVALGLPAQSRADDAPQPVSETPVSETPVSETPVPEVPVPEVRPSVLVVALDLRDPVRQAGVVKQGAVILARGLEVDLAREIARRVGIPKTRFVYVRPASRVLAAKAPAWHIGLAAIRASNPTPAQADLSVPYLGADQAVVLRRGLRPLVTLGNLRSLRTCALRGSAGVRAISTIVLPASRPVVAPTSERLFQLVQTGVCDAALVDADEVGRFVAGRGALLGPVKARVEGGDGYVVAVTRGGPVATADVGRALARMRADGTMHRLARKWLQIDPAGLRALRGVSATRPRRPSPAATRSTGT